MFPAYRWCVSVLQKCFARRLGACSETGVLPGLEQAQTDGETSSGHELVSKCSERPVGGAGSIWMSMHTFLLSFDLATMSTQELTDPGHPLALVHGGAVGRMGGGPHGPEVV